jgi:hypothetical protein
MNINEAIKTTKLYMKWWKGDSRVKQPKDVGMALQVLILHAEQHNKNNTKK